MTILEHVRGVADAIETPKEDLPVECKISLRRKLLALNEKMERDEDTEIPAEVFEALGPIGRDLTLSAFVIASIKILNEEISEESRA